MALFDREAQGILSMLGIDLAADNSVTRNIFWLDANPLR
jgi:hypothetical protein